MRRYNNKDVYINSTKTGVEEAYIASGFVRSQQISKVQRGKASENSECKGSDLNLMENHLGAIRQYRSEVQTF